MFHLSYILDSIFAHIIILEYILIQTTCSMLKRIVLSWAAPNILEVLSVGHPLLEVVIRDSQKSLAMQDY